MKKSQNSLSDFFVPYEESHNSSHNLIEYFIASLPEEVIRGKVKAEENSLVHAVSVSQNTFSKWEQEEELSQDEIKELCHGNCPEKLCSEWLFGLPLLCIVKDKGKFNTKISQQTADSVKNYLIDLIDNPSFSIWVPPYLINGEKLFEDSDAILSLAETWFEYGKNAVVGKYYEDFVQNPHSILSLYLPVVIREEHEKGAVPLSELRLYCGYREDGRKYKMKNEEDLLHFFDGKQFGRQIDKLFLTEDQLGCVGKAGKDFMASEASSQLIMEFNDRVETPAIIYPQMINPDGLEKYETDLLNQLMEAGKESGQKILVA